MKIGMRSGLDPNSLGSAHWDHAVLGTILGDGRSKAALDFATEHAEEMHFLTYEPSTFSYTLDG